MRIGSVSGTKGGLVAISAKQDLTPIPLTPIPFVCMEGVDK